MDGDTPAISTAVGVAVLLGDHWGALDFDFRHVLGLDLEECCFGPDALGVRRLKDYIAYLPSTSAIAREMGWSWDDMREMTATLIELAVNQRRKKGTKPFKYPRPGDLLRNAMKQEERPPLTRQGMRAALLGPIGGGA